MWWIFVLKAFKTARLPAWNSIIYIKTKHLMSGLTYCAHGNTLPLKVGIRRFPALFSMNVGNLSLVLHLSGTGLTSRQTSMGLSSVTSHRGDSKAPQPFNLWRQPQEHELSVTAVTTALRAVNSPRSLQSLCASNLQKRIWNSKPAKARSTYWKGEQAIPLGLWWGSKERKRRFLKWGEVSGLLPQVQSSQLLGFESASP